jgi:hypothetical protein
LELATSPRHRRRLLAGAGLAIALAGVTAALVFASSGPGTTTFGRISFAVVAAGLGWLAGVLVRAALAPAGSLLIDHDGVVLRHPQLLTGPLVLPRDVVRSVLVDDAPARASGGLPAELAARFALVETGDEPAWLHPGAREVMPYLGFHREPPNVAVVLRHPLDLGRVPRRTLALLEGNEEMRALATCAGFFLRAGDPRAVEARARASGLDDPVTLTDAGVLAGFATDRRWFRRRP